MSNWQVGDLAACIDASDRGGCAPNSARVLRHGVVYTVVGICSPARWRGGYCGVGLILAEVLQPENEDGDFAADRFRKVVTDKREACEPEFVTLLKRIKRTAPAETASEWLLRAGPIAKDLNEQSRKDQ